MDESSRNHRQKTPGRGPGRPFERGNPGRPKGARRKVTVAVEKLLAEGAEDVAKALLDAAKGGDVQAMRVVMERVCPVRRGRPVDFELPDAEGAAGLAEAFRAVTNAVASGGLTPEEGASVAAVLEARRKAIELIEIEARLKALEQRTWTGTH